MLIQKIHHVAYRCKDAKQTVEWYEKHLGMKFVLAIAENEVPSTKAPDPYMHVFLDAGNGQLIASWLPTGTAAGDTIRSWISALHMASMWGWPFKLFICAMGLAVAMLSVTGVLVWRRKRQGQAQARWRRIMEK